MVALGGSRDNSALGSREGDSMCRCVGWDAFVDWSSGEMADGQEISRDGSMAVWLVAVDVGPLGGSWTGAMGGTVDGVVIDNSVC